MATTLPQFNAAPNTPLVSPDYMQRLETLAQNHGWSLDEAMKRALDITEVVLDAKDDPQSKVYVYRSGRRYALEVEE